MQENREMPTWLSDIVFRIKQSQLTLSIDHLGQLNLSDSLKAFLMDIITLASKDNHQPPTSQLLQKLNHLDLQEIEEICTVVDVVLGSQNKKATIQYIQHQFVFPPPKNAPQKTFSHSFGLPNEFPHFTGRKDALDELELNLSQPPRGGHSKFLLSGTGGIGKTQLAAATAHRLLNSYAETQGKRGCRTVIWFIAGTDESIDSQGLMTEQFQRLGEQLGFDPSALKAEELIKVIYQRLRDEHGPFLVVFDNAHNIRNLISFMPPANVPIIITTRNNYERDFDQTFKSIALTIFTEPEALTYIHTVMQVNHLYLYREEEAKLLANALGYFPLALTQALAYIITENRPIRDYLEEFSQQKAQYLQEPLPMAEPYQEEKNPSEEKYTSLPKENYDPHKATVWAVIQLSLKKVMQADANQILKACAYLAPEEPIDTNLLGYWTATPSECRVAIANLRRYSLIENVNIPNHIRIHQLVQEILKLTDNDEAKEVFLICLAEFIAEYFHKTTNPLADEARKKILFPHLLAVLSQIEQHPKVNQIFEQKKARLKYDLGTIYTHMENAGEAARYFQQAVEFYESSQDERPLAKSLVNLGGARGALGDAAGAKALIERSLAIEERLYGDDHPEVVGALINLGNVNLDLGDVPRAKILYERALAIVESTYKPEHLQVAQVLTNVGNVIRAQGDAMGAKVLYERSLPILERIYGPEHPKVAKTLESLGNAILELGDAPRAKVLFERVLAINERAYGPMHTVVALALSNLGNALDSLGSNAEAKALYERALVITEHVYGPEHLEVAKILTNLGSTHITLGNALQGRALLERALTIKERTYGSEHPKVASTLMNLANAMDSLGDAAGAKACYERVLVINERSYGREHIEVAKALTNLGNVTQALGDVAGSIALYERALAIKERTYGPKHPEVAKTLTNLANVTDSLGHKAEAKVLYKRALIILEHYYGPEHPEVARTLMNLGTALDHTMESQLEAKALYERAILILERVYGSEHLEVVITRFNLGQLLLRLKKPSAALKHFQYCAHVFSRQLGDDHVYTRRARDRILELEEQNQRSSLTYDNQLSQSINSDSVITTSVELLTQLLKNTTYPSTRQLLTVSESCFATALFSQTLVLLKCIPEYEVSFSGLLLRAKCQLSCHQFFESRETISFCQGLADDDDSLTQLTLFSEKIEVEQQQITQREVKLRALQSKTDLSVRDQIIMVTDLRFLRRFDEALVLVNKIIVSQPSEELLAPAYFQQAHCYFALQRYRDARRSCELSAQLKDTPKVTELNQKISLAVEIAPKLEQLISQLQSSRSASPL